MTGAYKRDATVDPGPDRVPVGGDIMPFSYFVVTKPQKFLSTCCYDERFNCRLGLYSIPYRLDMIKT